MKLKKVLAAVLTGAMVIGSMAVSAFADGSAEVKYSALDSAYSYTVASDVATVNVAIEYAAAFADGSEIYNDWCASGLTVTHTDGSVDYYAFGGAQVGWDISFTDEELGEVAGGAKNEDGQYFLLDAGKGSFDVAVEQGAVIDVIAMGWDSKADETQYTVTITGDAGAADTEAGEDSSTGATTLPIVLAAVASLAVAATVKKFAEER